MSHHAARETSGEPARSGAEAARLGLTQRELREDFPWVPPDHVDAIVEGFWKHYEGARVRDFVPLLVGRHARDALRDLGRPPSPAPTVPQRRDPVGSSRPVEVEDGRRPRPADRRTGIGQGRHV